jgi:hypothetical protein
LFAPLATKRNYIKLYLLARALLVFFDIVKDQFQALVAELITTAATLKRVPKII